MTPKAIAARTAGAMLPADPYVKNWSGKQMRQIAEEIGDHALYKTPYSDLSERHHWDPAGLARGIQIKDGTIGYNAISSVSRAGALAVAFQSLYESARVVDTALGGTRRAELDSMIRLYLVDARTLGIDLDRRPPAPDAV